MNHQKQTAADRAAKRTEIAARRKNVAALALMRVPQEDIAVQVRASEATISGDLKAIRAGWYAERQRDIAALQAQELAACDTDEHYWRKELARLTPDLRGVPAAEVVGRIAVTLTARLAIYATIDTICKRRGKLLGLDAPQKHDYTLSIRAEAERLAAESGADVDAVLREFEQIVGARR